MKLLPNDALSIICDQLENWRVVNTGEGRLETSANVL